jgi:hypothetical protein
MLQAGGIDKLVEQKADAYRGNPQALQKRYSQNQELMDLLAMQKLKTEKEAASRDMALQAEQTPSTIAEQYEQQLVSMNKDEMAGQVAGVLGQKQKQAQQKQQAMGMPPQKPQGQRPPMPQGAPQGIASQPRPNMQGMAQGGIIGYAAGDKVEAKGSRLEQALKAIGISYKDYMAMRPEQKKGLDAQIQQEYIKQRKDFKVPQMPISAAIDKAMVPTPERVASDAAAKANYDKKQSMGATGLDALLADDALLAEEADQVAKATDAANAVNVATGQTIGQPPAGQAPAGQAPAGGVGGVNQNLARVGLDVAGLTATPDTSGISKKQVTDALAGTGVMEGLKKDIAKDPAKVQQDELTRMSGADKSKGGLDRAGQEATYNKYLKEKEDLDKELLDPARLKRERANAGIRGLIEGGTSRGASIAKGKFDENTVASRQASITQRLGIEQKRMDNDVKIATEINAEAGRAMGRVMDERQKAMATVANIAADDLAMYNAEADRMYESNQNGIKNKIDALKADTDAKLNELVQRQASASEIASQISSLHDKSTALREEFFKSINPQLTILREKEASEGLTSDEQGQMEKYESQFQQLVEKTEISEAIKVLNSLLLQIRDQGGYSLQSTSSNTNTSTTKSGQSGSSSSTALSSAAANAQKYIKP